MNYKVKYTIDENYYEIENTDLGECTFFLVKIDYNNSTFTETIDFSDILILMSEYLKEYRTDYFRMNNKVLNICSRDKDLVLSEDFIQQVINKNDKLELSNCLFFYTEQYDENTHNRFRERDLYKTEIIDYLVDILFHHDKENDIYEIRYDSNLNLIDDFKVTDVEIEEKRNEIKSQIYSLEKELEKTKQHDENSTKV
jgi:hypothetical protein